MSTLDFKVLDLDFPAGSKNKTATLVTGEREALLVDAGFTRADGHRLAAEILDSGKSLTTVFVSHADPDFYFGAEVVADAFPEARFVATPLVIEHIRDSYQGKLKAWEALGPNLPTRLVELTELTGDLTLEG
ncbi:MBL fold metallo-hydrolase, partial [Streptomyces griseorubiginosus]